MRPRITKFIKDKEVYLIYLFAYPTFFFFNNVFRNIHDFIFYDQVKFRWIVRAAWCKKYNFEFDKVIREFLVFESLKLMLILLFFMLYQKHYNVIKKKNIFEICVAFLLFDFFYLILSPIHFINDQLNWHYGSQLYQTILNNLPDFPTIIVPLFWVIVLAIFVFFTERIFNFKSWIYRLGGVFIIIYILSHFSGNNKCDIPLYLSLRF
ncbi:MAG: hypothetical protein RLZZ306_2411 [Bacteroidota bacterium]